MGIAEALDRLARSASFWSRCSPAGRIEIIPPRKAILANGGLFISFEGIEGSGKSTQIEMLKSRLEEKGHRVVLTKEPGGTWLGLRLRGILLDSANDDIDPLAELLLYEAARVQHVKRVISPAVARGDVVLCDRFTDSTIAYQGHGRGLDIEFLEKINELASCRVQPDLTILLDLDPEIGLGRAARRIERAAGAGRAEDRFESYGLDFHRKVRSGYLKIAADEPERVAIIDAGAGQGEVHSMVMARVEKLLGQRGMS